MKIAVCPGSYDPITLGHIDIIQRTAGIFDRVIVLILQNEQKSPVFSLSERADIAKKAFSDIPNAIVETYSGLGSDFALEVGACAIIKGVRSAIDYEYERIMATVNTTLNAPETLLLPSNPNFSHVSTSTALHLYKLGADVTSFLPKASIEALMKKRF